MLAILLLREKMGEQSVWNYVPEERY